jgi:hypothetical protein
MVYRLENFTYTSAMEVFTTNLIEKKVEMSNEKEIKG